MGPPGATGTQRQEGSGGQPLGAPTGHGPLNGAGIRGDSFEGIPNLSLGTMQSTMRAHEQSTSSGATIAEATVVVEV